MARRRSRTRARARTRTVTRRSAPRRARRSFGGGGWIPLSMRETLTAGAVGAITPKANQFVAPYTDGILGVFGNYKDEARTALIGVAAYKLGSGVIKDAGREMFRYAVLSAGQQLGASAFNGTTNGGLSGGVVMA